MESGDRLKTSQMDLSSCWTGSLQRTQRQITKNILCQICDRPETWLIIGGLIEGRWISPRRLSEIQFSIISSKALSYHRNVILCAAIICSARRKDFSCFKAEIHYQFEFFVEELIIPLKYRHHADSPDKNKFGNLSEEYFLGQRIDDCLRKECGS